MEILVKGGFLRKKKFKLEKYTAKLIEELSRKYKIPPEKLILMALKEEKLERERNERMKELQEKISSLLDEMFQLEGKWASIRYKSYTYAKENRTLAIILTGHLSENRSLRRILKKKNAHKDIEELVNYYLWL